MKLDELDLKIIHELKNDGRITVSDLAKKLGSSRPTVTNRVKRLQEEGLVDVAGGLNLVRVGYEMATVNLEVMGDDARRKLINLLISCPRVLTIFRTPGRANLAVGIWGEDHQTINSTVESFRDMDLVEVVNAHYLGTPIHGSVNIDVELNKSEASPCDRKCSGCLRYVNGWCVGCPGTTHYKNPLLK